MMSRSQTEYLRARLRVSLILMIIPVMYSQVIYFSTALRESWLGPFSLAVIGFGYVWFVAWAVLSWRRVNRLMYDANRREVSES